VWGRNRGEDSNPDILVVAASRYIALSVYGAFYLSTFDLGDLPGIEVFDVHLTEDMSQLVALVKSDVPGESKYQIDMVNIDTMALSTQKSQIGDVLSQLQQIHALLAYLDSVTKAMKSQWGANMTEVKTKISQLGILLKDNACDSSPREELLSMLVCGIVSAPLSQFIVERLGGPGITVLDKKMDQTCSGVLQLLNDHLSPATEQIIFRLGELEGLARWKVRFDGVGLKAEAISALTDLATRMRAKIEKTLLLLCRVRANYASFFRWLARMCTLLSDQGSLGSTTATSKDLDTLADFLHHDLPEDRVGGLLEASPSSRMEDGDASDIASALSDLKEGVEAFCKVPGEALHKTFQVSSQTSLYQSPVGTSLPQSTLRSCTIKTESGNTVSEIQRAMVTLVVDEKLYVVKGPNRKLETVAVAQLPSEEGTPLVSDFYLDDAVAVLTKGEESGARSSILSFEEVEFDEMPLMPGQCHLALYQGGPCEVEEVGKAFPFVSGQFNKLVALGTKKLCCAYAPPKRLVVFEPEPEDDDDSDEEEDEE